MTLIATWYPTEEQKCEFNSMCRNVYGDALWQYLHVDRVELMREEDERDKQFVIAYAGSARYILVFVAPELIKAGYFVL